MRFSLYKITFDVGDNICERYPRQIVQGLNDASCTLGSVLSSLVGLPNPAWVSLANVVYHMDDVASLQIDRCMRSDAMRCMLLGRCKKKRPEKTHYK